jgi:hypothetical protein
MLFALAVLLYFTFFLKDSMGLVENASLSFRLSARYTVFKSSQTSERSATQTLWEK